MGMSTNSTWNGTSYKLCEGCLQIFRHSQKTGGVQDSQGKFCSMMCLEKNLYLVNGVQFGVTSLHGLSRTLSVTLSRWQTILCGVIHVFFY